MRSGLALATSTYTYNDARGFLTRVLTTKGATTLIDQTYARNPKGLITAITSPQGGRSWAYGYDALDRLITAANSNTPSESRTYAYDDADNLTYNSGLCAANPNLIYNRIIPPPPPAAPINLTATFAAQMTATMSSTIRADYVAAKIFDNNAATIALTYAGAAEWIKLDLGASYSIGQWRH